MKTKVFMFVFSALSILISLILIIVRDSLLLSEYSQTGFSELIYYQPLTVFAIMFASISAFLFILGLLICFSHRIFLKKKKLICICSAVVALIVCITTISAVCFVNNTEIINRSTKVFDDDFVEEQPNEEIPAEYEFILPFLNDINDYYTLKCISTSQAKYIHTQNYGANESGMFVYDVEFFKTDNFSLMQQYIYQKDKPGVTTQNGVLVVNGEEEIINGVECIVYEYNNYLQLRIIDYNSCYSIVFDNLYGVSNKTVTDFKEVALDIYFQLENKNSSVERY